MQVGAVSVPITITLAPLRYGDSPCPIYVSVCFSCRLGLARPVALAWPVRPAQPAGPARPSPLPHIFSLCTSLFSFTRWSSPSVLSPDNTRERGELHLLVGPLQHAPPSTKTSPVALAHSNSTRKRSKHRPPPLPLLCTPPLRASLAWQSYPQTPSQTQPEPSWTSKLEHGCIRLRVRLFKIRVRECMSL